MNLDPIATNIYLANIPDDAYDLATGIIRITLGVMIIAHGYAKGVTSSKRSGTAGWFHSIGMRPGGLHAFLAAYTEMTIGALLVLGLLTTFAAAGLVGVMVVAGWTVHRKSGFLITKGGYEYVALIALMSVALATLGPGEASLDHQIGIAQDLNGWTGLWLSAGLGIAMAVLQLAAFFRPKSAAESND